MLKRLISMYNKLITNPEKNNQAAKSATEGASVLNKEILKLIVDKKLKIIEAIEKNNKDLSALNDTLKQIKKDFQTARAKFNGELCKAHYFNSAISEVILDKSVVAKINCYRSALNLLIAQADEVTGTFKTCATKYLDILEKYTDMQDLLLLDPIHEVDDGSGWPTPKDSEVD